MRRVRRRVRARARRPARPSHLRTNLSLWEGQSDRYDRRFAAALGGRSAMAWGFWRTPESSLGLLGPVRGRDVLEVGCGAARWSVALAAFGAHVVGLDLSPAQLGKARRISHDAGRPIPLVRANAEHLPFRDRSFDLAFSDWGAMTFADPHRTVPEVARILRPGGRLVFATSSPLRTLAQERRTGRIGTRLRFDYFGLHRVEYPNEVDFALPYGEWVRLFREAGLVVTRLVEPRAPARRTSPYLSAEEERWGRRWPLEILWQATKPASALLPSSGRRRSSRGRAGGRGRTHRSFA